MLHIVPFLFHVKFVLFFLIFFSFERPRSPADGFAQGKRNTQASWSDDASEEESKKTRRRRRKQKYSDSSDSESDEEETSCKGQYFQDDVLSSLKRVVSKSSRISVNPAGAVPALALFPSVPALPGDQDEDVRNRVCILTASCMSTTGRNEKLKKQIKAVQLDDASFTQGALEHFHQLESTRGAKFRTTDTAVNETIDAFLFANGLEENFKRFPRGWRPKNCQRQLKGSSIGSWQLTSARYPTASRRLRWKFYQRPS